MEGREERLYLALCQAGVGEDVAREAARDEASGDVPRATVLLFLREVWKRVLVEDEPNWIDEAVHVAESNPRRPFAGMGVVLSHLRQLGASDAEVAHLCRVAQVKLLASLCSLLDLGVDGLVPESSDVCWALVAVDGDGNVGSQVVGLLEELLPLDPTGRDGRISNELLASINAKRTSSAPQT
jgi:hypothetical protein